jgi:hypothetical protein
MVVCAAKNQCLLLWALATVFVARDTTNAVFGGVSIQPIAH